MTQLYIKLISQSAPDSARSTVIGALTYAATSIYTAPTQLYIYDYGVSANSSATPFPVFIGDTDARAYFDPIASAQLISDANSYMGSSYYTTSDIELVDAPVLADFAGLATVAKTGSYLDLTNTPSIPAAQVNTDWNVTSGLPQLLNKPSLSTVATSGAYSDLSGKPSLATVATTGAYSDLTGKPTVPTVQAYEGTTQRLNAFYIFKDATVASGVAVFNLTSDGTSGGTALFSSGVIADSVNVTVSDATASYQMSWAWSNSNKTLTVTANKLTTANILTGLLGQAAANGAVVKLQVMGY